MVCGDARQLAVGFYHYYICEYIHVRRFVVPMPAYACIHLDGSAMDRYSVLEDEQ